MSKKHFTILRSKIVLISIYIDIRYKGAIQIFTDGSKDPENNTVRCTFVVPDLLGTYTFKLDGNLTVFSSELLRWANRNKLEKLVIFTDSLSSVQSMNSGKSRTRQDVPDQILREISIILNKEVDLDIDWCPIILQCSQK